MIAGMHLTTPQSLPMRRVNMACDLLDLWFIWVAPVTLAVLPTSNHLKASSVLDTGCSVVPTTTAFIM